MGGINHAQVDAGSCNLNAQAQDFAMAKHPRQSTAPAGPSPFKLGRFFLVLGHGGPHQDSATGTPLPRPAVFYRSFFAFPMIIYGCATR